MEDDLWETTELSLAVYLQIKLGVDPVLGWSEDLTFCHFGFKRSDALAQHVLEFTSGEAMVEPKACVRAVGGLRTAMFTDRRAIKREERSASGTG